MQSPRRHWHVSLWQSLAAHQFYSGSDQSLPATKLICFLFQLLDSPPSGLVHFPPKQPRQTTSFGLDSGLSKSTWNKGQRRAMPGVTYCTTVYPRTWREKDCNLSSFMIKDSSLNCINICWMVLKESMLDRHFKMLVSFNEICFSLNSLRSVFRLSVQKALSCLQNSASWMESLDTFLHLNFDQSEYNFRDTSLAAVLN